MRSLVVLIALLAHAFLFAQVDTATVPFSENGWSLSPHGTIRVLLIFAEIEYDKTPSDDPNPGGSDHWPKGKLPVWKDDVFDPQLSRAPIAMVSRYYHDISLGQFEVLGDYIDEIVTIKEGENPSIKNVFGLGTLAVKELGSRNGLKTHHNLSISDFDLWKRGGKPGLPKEAGPDDPHSYDHVMVIVRNSRLTHGQGSVDSGSPGKLVGYESDSQSRFGGMNALPFEILKHEFNHLLLGGNNFHSGGGNAPMFQSYFMSLQGGWSMMGAANSSLLTACAWDRDRLGWRAKDGCSRINARDANSNCVNGDLDPLNGDTGVYVIRDFVTTGDALRIKMPYLNTNEYPQFLWLENHQGWKNNGSPTDRFHFEKDMPCVQGVVPGIFAVMQVDREEKSGKEIYRGEADYLRALPASGFYDMYLRGDTVRFECLWPANTTPLIVKDGLANPLSGASELEAPLFDTRGADVLMRSKDGIVPKVEVRNGNYIDEAMFYGHARQIFTVNGNRELGLGTNPPLANMLTLTSSSGKTKYNGSPPDNRVVHLTGINVELTEQRTDGSIVLQVRNDMTLVDQDVRWCGDSIVLHTPVDTNNYALHIAEGRSVTIDRSRTPTRIADPDTVRNERFFSKRTTFVIESGAHVLIDDNAELNVTNGSVLHVMPGCVIDLSASAKFSSDKDSRIVLHGDAIVNGTAKQLKDLCKEGRSERVP